MFRFAFTLMLISSIGCAEPDCFPNEVKVGMSCRKVGAEDASTDNSMADSRESDGGRPNADGADAQLRDGTSVSTERDAALAPATAPDASAAAVSCDDAGCVDECPADPLKREPGACGCGVPELAQDTDGDGTLDCNDACPMDACSELGSTCLAAPRSTIQTCSEDANGCRISTERQCDGSCWEPSRCTKIDRKFWPTNETVFVKAITVDRNGNAYAAGYTTTSVYGQAPSGGEDAFITKWSPDGDLLWSTQWGSSSDDEIHAIAVNSTGDRLAVAGTVGGTSTATQWF